MHLPRSAALLAALLLAVTAALGACGGDSDEGSGSSGSEATEAGSETGSEAGTDAGDDLDEALEAQTPEETVEVPSEDGATTIAEYAAGGSAYEPADAAELAQILSLVGTDADGYLTADAVVVRVEAADATLLCQTAERLGISTYALIPMLPDGTGVACG